LIHDIIIDHAKAVVGSDKEVHLEVGVWIVHDILENVHFQFLTHPLLLVEGSLHVESLFLDERVVCLLGFAAIILTVPSFLGRARVPVDL